MAGHLGVTRLCILPSLIAALVSSQAAVAEPGRLGVMLDAGVPDGVTGSLVFRPVRAVMIHGGVGHNLIGPGVRAGVSLQPLPWAVRPSLSLEAGHYFPGDANRALRRVGAVEPDSEDNPMLEEVGYQYANAHLGLELGRSRAVFYIHAGFSAVRGRIRNAGAALAGDDQTIELRDDPEITLWTPSARLGLIIFL